MARNDPLHDQSRGRVQETNAGERLESTDTRIPVQDESTAIAQQPPSLSISAPTTKYARFRQDRPLLVASLQAAILFIGASVLAFLALKVLLPPIDPEDAPKLRLPKSFDDLKAINELVQDYKTDHLARVVASFVVIYLFLQAFSLPGSMYLSILGGSLFNLWALPLVCTCIATGASFCYGLSAIMGPAILANSSKWRNRIAGWKRRIRAQDSILNYLIVLRIAPLPPHSVVNIVSPHLGIPLRVFWPTTWLGCVGVTYIHVSIGTALDSMTSSDDFHLLSNVVGLCGIVLAVLAPVIVRHLWKKELVDAATESAVGAIALPLDEEEGPPYRTLGHSVKDQSSKLVFLDSHDRPLPPRTVDNDAVTQRRDSMQRARQHLYASTASPPKSER